MKGSTREQARNLGLLLLRVGVGGLMAVQHGLPKLLKFSEKAETFSDPIGLGSTLSLVAAVSAELGCSVLVVLGFVTRLASVPVVFTMLVAAFVVHGDDPFSKKELALLFATGFAAIGLLGPGAYSIDARYGRG